VVDGVVLWLGFVYFFVYYLAGGDWIGLVAVLWRVEIFLLFIGSFSVCEILIEQFGSFEKSKQIRHNPLE